jgi:exodeoxyribonuclease VII large subunit
MTDSDAVLSVSALNRLTQQTLEKAFPLMWIAGEVSNLTRAPSGHIYFTLKDAGAQVRCVMFRSRFQTVPWRLENGHQIEARARVTLYEARGDFQLNVESLRRAGLGRLFEAFNRLKEQLAAAGLFAAERKRPLPRYPRAIGIVSSPNAAALRDVIAALKRRAPHLPAILYPTPVQGVGAGEKIAAALQLAAEHARCDVLLLVRGGGSIEDLWAFNEEILARAIAACPLPVISGVGHESDTTIADFVADLRAATPTAAAELSTQGWVEASAEVAALGKAMSDAMQQRIGEFQQRLDHLTLRLLHPATRLQQTRDRTAMLRWRLDTAVRNELRRHRDHVNRCTTILERNAPRTESRRGRIALLHQRLITAMQRQHQQWRNALEHSAAALRHLNPQATLDRGFAIIRDEHGAIVADAAQLQPEQILNLRLARGSARTRVVSSSPDEADRG